MKKWIIGKSLIKKRIYVVDGIPIQLSEKYKYKGYEVVQIEPFRTLQLRSGNRMCSPPFNLYSAHHCFNSLTESALGKSYEADYEGKHITGEVVKDYVNPMKSTLMKILCPILAFFQTYTKYCSEIDLVELSYTFAIDGKVAGVLSAAPTSGQYALFSFKTLDESLIGQKFTSISYDFDAQKIVQWQGQIIDIVVLNVLDGEELVPVRGYLTQNEIRVKPGYSGSPMIIDLNTQEKKTTWLTSLNTVQDSFTPLQSG